MTVGELAHLTGVTTKAIRHYEERALLDNVRRSDEGHRVFSAECVGRVRLISGAQQVGFTLDEIRGLIALSSDPECTCAQVRDRARDKLKAIEQEIQDLLRTRAALTQLMHACPRHVPVDECPIVQAIEGRRPH